MDTAMRKPSHSIIAILIVSSLLVILATLSARAFFTLLDDHNQPIATLTTNESINQANQDEEDDQSWQQLQVKKGDNLASLFKSAHLTQNDMYTLLQDPLAKEILMHIQTHKTLKVKHDANYHLSELWYPLSDRDSLHVFRDQSGFHSEKIHYAQTQQLAFATATIDHSLFGAGSKAGIPDKVIAQLSDLFNWDIDFAQDLRPGDTFSVLYKLSYLSNNKILVGDIVAAEFFNKGVLHQAILFIDPNGNKEYFTPDGQSLKRAFIRTPVKYTRISDPFNMRRLHPILHTIRPHKGVDYAAPRGTPIKATGDGTISFLGQKGGYGNVIVIKHNWRYTTLYGHLSHFATGVHVGSHVKQNQIIGYVGSTGLATGPHLHYEFRINGIHRNPVRVKLPQAKPIAKNYRAYFLTHAAQFINLIHHFPKNGKVVS